MPEIINGTCWSCGVTGLIYKEINKCQSCINKAFVEAQIEIGMVESAKGGQIIALITSLVEINARLDVLRAEDKRIFDSLGADGSRGSDVGVTLDNSGE